MNKKLLPYLPHLQKDPKTSESTPHRVALGYLFRLIRAGYSEEDATIKIFEKFDYFKTLYAAHTFVVRNLWRVKRYINHHENLRKVKDNNYRRVICALTRAGAAKASELKVFGQGRGGKYVKRLSPICIERHLRRARKEGVATVDHHGVWRLTKQVDLNTYKGTWPIHNKSTWLEITQRQSGYVNRHIPNDLDNDILLTDSYCSLESVSDNQGSLEFDPRVLDRSLTDRHHSITDKAKNNTLAGDQYRLFKRWMIDDHSSRWFNDWRLFDNSMTDDHRLFGDLMANSLSTDRDRLRSFDSDEENDVRRRRAVDDERFYTLFTFRVLHRASCDRESG